jgi:hypothetical protein
MTRLKRRSRTQRTSDNAVINAAGQPVLLGPPGLVLETHHQGLIEGHPEIERVPNLVKQGLIHFEEFGGQTARVLGVLFHEGCSADESPENFFYGFGVFLHDFPSGCDAKDVAVDGFVGQLRSDGLLEWLLASAEDEHEEHDEPYPTQWAP